MSHTAPTSASTHPLHAPGSQASKLVCPMSCRSKPSTPSAPDRTRPARSKPPQASSRTLQHQSEQYPHQTATETPDRDLEQSHPDQRRRPREQLHRGNPRRDQPRQRLGALTIFDSRSKQASQNAAHDQSRMPKVRPRRRPHRFPRRQRDPNPPLRILRPPMDTNPDRKVLRTNPRE